MSQENVEIVRKALVARNTKGIEAGLRFFTDDVVWEPADEWPDGMDYSGHEGMRRLNAAFAENFDGFGFDVHEIREAGERVVVHLDLIGRVKNSGQAIRQPRGIVVSDFRGGRFGHLRTFQSWREALKAVGLEE